MHGTTGAFHSKHSYTCNSLWNLYTEPPVLRVYRNHWQCQGFYLSPPDGQFHHLKTVIQGIKKHSITYNIPTDIPSQIKHIERHRFAGQLIKQGPYSFLSFSLRYLFMM